MWMVDSNDRSKELKMPIDPIYGRKLRPLMPRPITGSCCCIPNPNLWNHPICGLSDFGVQRREIQTAAPLVSTRWNPTPEQLQALEEMYRRGIRTPSAEQIQQIAAKLRRFGKIEGKNVFYWFQNHKARERQKKRRQLELLPAKKTQHHAAHTIMLQQTELSRRRSFIEIEHQKMPTPSNSSTPAENSASMQTAAAEWPELHHKILTAKNEEAWQLDLSSSLSPNNCSTNTVTALKATAPEIKENQTLDLFPLQNAAAPDGDASSIQNNFRGPIQFIEFLPTKKY